MYHPDLANITVELRFSVLNLLDSHNETETALFLMRLRFLNARRTDAQISTIKPPFVEERLRSHGSLLPARLVSPLQAC